MSRFEIEMELQALKIRIKGDREEAASISHNIGQQMTSLLQPIAGIIEGEMAPAPASPTTVNGTPIQSPAKRTRRHRQSSGAATAGEPSAAINFAHDPEKFGYPRQQWKAAQKAIWLLYVVQQTLDNAELSAHSIAETFNRHFKQAGAIRRPNVQRDLGRLKTVDKPTPLGEDTTKSPSLWYLTDEGKKRGQSLVAEALGQSEQP